MYNLYHPASFAGGLKAKNKIYQLKLDSLLMIFWNRRWEEKFSPTSDICRLPALPKDKELAIEVSCCVNIPSTPCKISFSEIYR